MEKHKRKAFTLKKKYEITYKIKSGVKQSDIWKKLAPGKSTIAIIWKKNREIIL